uniref:Uncharacterized protein n=1 Tax=Physcomitrium patens TaxID=3218 RepID=A9SEZ9_PHYPA|nr:hypothetical protein PHYPA_007078 [Physcomitrium patens]
MDGLNFFMRFANIDANHSCYFPQSAKAEMTRIIPMETIQQGKKTLQEVITETTKQGGIQIAPQFDGFNVFEIFVGLPQVKEQDESKTKHQQKEVVQVAPQSMRQ